MISNPLTDDLFGEPHESPGDTGPDELTGDPANLSFTDEFLATLDRLSSGNGATAEGCVRVLDVGTGTARIPVEICMRRGNILFTAVDRATRALQTARQNVEQAGLIHAIRIEQADARALPYANACFDAVISSSLLHHVSNRSGVLSEMARVLRPGGLLLVRDTLRGSDARKIAQNLSRSKGETPQSSTFERAFHSMLNIDEARDLALAVGLPGECVRQSGPRHWGLEFRLQPARLEVNSRRGVNFAS